MQAAWHWATSVFGSLPEATKWLLICQHSLSGCTGAFRNDIGPVDNHSSQIQNLFDDNVGTPT